MDTSSQQDKDFVFFWGSSSVFSQFHQRPFVVNGQTYATAEQFMMASKARVFGDDAVAAKIMATRSPSKQKSLGRTVKKFKQGKWDMVKEDIVLEANLAKFSQHQDLKCELLATGQRELVEASPYDKIWGIGLGATDPRARSKAQWRGTNLLGQVLMQVRDRIRSTSNKKEEK
jgi:ribA/ribD-fused uncharacterized protein